MVVQVLLVRIPHGCLLARRRDTNITRETINVRLVAGVAGPHFGCRDSALAEPRDARFAQPSRLWLPARCVYVCLYCMFIRVYRMPLLYVHTCVPICLHVRLVSVSGE